MTKTMIAGMDASAMTDEAAFDVFAGLIDALMFSDEFKTMHSDTMAKVQFAWGPPNEPAKCNYTDHVITIPWPGARVTPAEYAVLRGYAMHELAHWCWTDTHAVAWAQKRGPLTEQVFNIMEDGRINRDLCANSNEYARHALNAVWKKLYHGRKPGPDLIAEHGPNVSPRDALLNDLLISVTPWLERYYKGHRWSDLAVAKRLVYWLGTRTDTVNAAEPLWSGTLQRPLMYLDPDHRRTNGDKMARHVDQFMRDFADVLGADQPPAEQDQQQQQGKQGKKSKQKEKGEKSDEKGEPDEGDDQDQESGPGDDEQGDEPNDGDEPSDGDDEGSGKGDAEGSGKGDAESEGDKAEKPKPEPMNLAKEWDKGSQSKADPIEFKKANARVPKGVNRGKYTNRSELRSESLPSTDPSPDRLRSAVADRYRRRGQAVTGTMRRALAAKSRFGDMTDRDDGDLDPDKLTDVALGKWDAPFMSPGRIIHDRDTAVAICIDGSSSMNEGHVDSSGIRYSEPSSPIKPEHLRAYANALAACQQASNPSLRDAIMAAADGLLASPSKWDEIRRSAENHLKHSYPVGSHVFRPNLIHLAAAKRVEAAGTMLAVHDALRASRVAHQITVFTGTSGHRDTTRGAYVVVKDWKQRALTPTAESIASSGFGEGGTPADGAWRRAVGALMKRPESRKILIVVTDGDTNNDPQAKNVLDAARSWGVETYGIGLQCEAIRGLFPQGSNIPVTGNGVDLTRAMLDMVNGILTKRGSRE